MSTSAGRFSMLTGALWHVDGRTSFWHVDGRSLALACRRDDLSFFTLFFLPYEVLFGIAERRLRHVDGHTCRVLACRRGHISSIWHVDGHVLAHLLFHTFQEQDDDDDDDDAAAAADDDDDDDDDGSAGGDDDDDAEHDDEDHGVGVEWGGGVVRCDNVLWS